ncbi:hypothetical protein [Streptomyces prunicolor]|uniref:Uncharacterized protein n=1 Tax=Streptomyces prunicolor TaxID=67348 RepID=A0ABU4F3T9_9ACTN|nr:hypothetical protein [Streptomyces prunicolor]MDV7214611.1 hypothetical protein [Streptomyces prunicolor]
MLTTEDPEGPWPDPNNRLSTVEISPDARRVLGPPVTVIDGDDGLCTFRFRTTRRGMDRRPRRLSSPPRPVDLRRTRPLRHRATAPPGTPGTGQAYFGAVGAT